MNTETQAMVQMPKYRCHKEVWALKIERILIERDGSGVLHFVDRNYASRLVGQDYIKKHSPEEGGYFVVYKDGYESFSPRGAFEAGYTLTQLQKTPLQ